MIFRRRRPARETPVADEEWQVRGSRFQQDREGQPLDIAGRVAICPRGHARAIPTRFDRPVAELSCPQCGRSYRFPEESGQPGT